jgi:squalene-hopene/tetraprenyl-beta-curcumene cyclase
LTAHTLRAICPFEALDSRISGLKNRALDYLSRQQRADGSWLPLWFGHQDDPSETNPVFGTARVLAAYRDLGLGESVQAKRAVEFLRGTQNPDGGWGGHQGIPSQIEETGLVVEALRSLKNSHDLRKNGQNWLVRKVLEGGLEESAPIGFYFAKLWYYEN